MTGARGNTLPTIAAIQSAVAIRHNIPVESMREPRPQGRRCGANAYSVSHPRQEAIALSFLLTEHSRIRIGHFFGGRDPTTVRHACEVIAKRRGADPKLDQAMKRMTLELVRGV